MYYISSITDHISARFKQKKVILIGHSYGTYIATKAAGKAPEKFAAYVGIGQMSDLIKSELDSLRFCISEASIAGNTSDSKYLQGIIEKVKDGEMITPRGFVRKYGGASRLIDDNKDYLKGFCSEANTTCLM